MSPVRFESAYSDDALVVGEWERVFVLVWRGRPTRQRIAGALAASHAISRRVSGQLSMLGVIEPGSPPPRLPDIVYSARAFDELNGVLAASAAVLEGRPSASRILDAVAHIQSLRRRPTPSRFCADVAEAATWLATRHPSCPEDFRVELVRAVEELRAHLPARGAMT